MTTPSAHDWIREIKPELKNLDSIPLTGAASPFPWSQLALRLAQTFDREILINPGEVQWRTKDQLYEGLGDSPLPLAFVIPPFKGTAYWLMPEQDMAILESLLLIKDAHPVRFQDRALSESFYRFLALEVLYHMSQVDYDKSIVPILISHSTLPAGNALCCDFSIYIEHHTLSGRLMISPELRQSWVEHYSHKAPSELTNSLAQEIEITIHLEANRINLTYQEWKSLKLGDCILLENCPLDPATFNGPVMMTLNEKAIFQANLENGNLKIIEVPLYYEVEIPMANQESQEPENDDLDDLDDLDDESLTDEDFLTEEEFDDLAPMVEETENPTGVAPPVPTIEAQPSTSPQEPMPKETGPIALNQIPVAVVVEIGSIQMTMQKLLQLEPGNILELGIHPDNGVNLIVNGKCVGKGELIRLGEVLGVRITNLGKQSFH